MSEKRHPLANDINGDPFEVPPTATAWRVRRRSGKQGRPQSVFDAETGTPLEIELDADIEELRPYGAGGYRLDAIDGDSKVMAGVTAYVEVPSDEVKALVAESPSETAATLREVVGLLRESIQAQCRTIDAMAGAFGTVKPVLQETPVVVVPPPAAMPSVAPAEQKDLMSKIFEMMPMINGFLQMMGPLMQSFGGNSAAAGAAAAPQAAPTVGGPAPTPTSSS